MKVTHSQPFEIFSNWLRDAENNSQIIEPTAMSLATVGRDNKPSNRMVLLKKFDEKGFCFFTNLTSRKGGELERNQSVALCFYWGILGRQVRIEGEVKKVSDQEANDYFLSRRRGSQIGAWASKQSQIMENDEEFKNRILKFEKQFDGIDVLRPQFWSGFRCDPNVIEFWEEGEFRIHTRTIYKKHLDGWEILKFYP